MSHILIDRLTQAASLYRGQLCAAHRAVTYLKARGPRGDIAACHGLGYAPAGFQAPRETFLNYNGRTLEKAGLVAVSDDDRHYDRFHDRIMFPVLDDAGNVIDFGGRVLEGDGPKYFNSPETEASQKGRIPFGLIQAAEAIAVTGIAYVVEGHLDVVSLTQHGMQNTVATLDTAVTGRHVERLLGLAKCMIFCFGGDDTGRRAVVCALNVCLPHVTDTVDVSFLFPPCDRDPDSHVHAKGGDIFNDLTLEASSLEDFSLASVMQSCQLEYVEGRARLVAAAAPHLQRVDALVMLYRILIAIAGPSKFSVGELIDLCSLRKNVLSTTDRQ